MERHNAIELIKSPSAVTLGLTAVLMLANLGCRRAAEASACQEPVEANEALTQSTVEFFDAHGHLLPSWADGVLTDVLQEGDLSGMVVLGPVPADSAGTGSLVPCAFIDVGEQDLAGLQEQLDAGARCIGEVSIRHFASGPGATADEHLATSPFLMSVYEEARLRGVPVIVHFDYGVEHISEFESALEQGEMVGTHAGSMGILNRLTCIQDNCHSGCS